VTRLGLSRFNTVALLTAAGMVAGHWIQPAPGVVIWRRGIVFLGAMALVGALRGWRESVLHRPPPSRRHTLVLAGGYAAGAVLLMAVGYIAFHGIPG